MKKISVDDFEIEKNNWGYYFSSCINFLEQESEVLLNHDTEEDISEIELKNILSKSLEKINNIFEKAEKNKAQLMELLKEGDYINLATDWVE
uniref:hypothetical protein n=1 Tax=Fusobacterium sp. TaxID=68766 RepID=UPI00262A979B